MSTDYPTPRAGVLTTAVWGLLGIRWTFDVAAGQLRWHFTSPTMQAWAPLVGVWTALPILGVTGAAATYLSAAAVLIVVYAAEALAARGGKVGSPSSRWGEIGTWISFGAGLAQSVDMGARHRVICCAGLLLVFLMRWAAHRLQKFSREFRRLADAVARLSDQNGVGEPEPDPEPSEMASSASWNVVPLLAAKRARRNPRTNGSKHAA
ncbi:hypothetical protein [Amycolatopsis echigonensis]|uniref:Uncharacterized protein n=1 Tax=Amycolatopsis echigonensis TaxID=2576905 RepID=A0A8E1W915_9PSEU|nr:hypothetical protein [Amycolatopsis echigonensis]MBB2506351.1 hypothetical protein [Amycolatopsis echigonensis]